MQQVCHDTGHAVLEYCQHPEPQNVHDRLLLWWLEHDQVKGVSTLKSSQAVSHTSTNQALCRLSLEVGRELALDTLGFEPRAFRMQS